MMWVFRTKHFLECFLTMAEGDFLDIHGKMFNLFRKKDESDEDYRNYIE